MFIHNLLHHTKPILVLHSNFSRAQLGPSLFYCYFNPWHWYLILVTGWLCTHHDQYPCNRIHGWELDTWNIRLLGEIIILRKCLCAQIQCTLCVWIVHDKYLPYVRLEIFDIFDISDIFGTLTLYSSLINCFKMSHKVCGNCIWVSNIVLALSLILKNLICCALWQLFGILVSAGIQFLAFTRVPVAQW